MQVIFYSNFKKRINSTKRPSGGTTIDCVMKQATDTHEPVLRLTNIAPGAYNYFKLGEHYFYITSEIVFPNNYIEIHGSLDSMATCADDIKSTTAFVARSNVGSLQLVDSYAPAMTDTQLVAEAEENLFADFSETGTYVVTVANSPRPVAMTYGEMLTLYNRLNSDDVIEQIANNFCDFSSFISGCIWLPYQVPTTGSLSLKAGIIDTGVSASYISNDITTAGVSFSIPSDSTCLTSSAYMDLKIYLPHCGTVNLSVDEFKDTGTVNIVATRDNITGGISYLITDGTYFGTVATFSGSCAIPIPIGSTSYNLGALGGGIASTAIGVLTGNPIAAIQGVASMFSGLQTTSQAGGGNGGTRTTIRTAVMSVFKRNPPEPLGNKSSVVGLPTMRTMSLGAISGYVQCIGASIQSTHDMNAISECNNFLNSGAWIE